MSERAVIDIGSSSFKLGISEDEEREEYPRFISPSYYYYSPMQFQYSFKIIGGYFHYGNENWDRKQTGVQEVRALFNQGRLDTNQLDLYLDECLRQLIAQCASSDEMEMMLGVNLCLSNAEKERTAQILFEDFSMPTLCTASNPALAALAAGLSTCLVMDFGNTLQIAPVLEGQVLKQSAICKPGGGLATDYIITRFMNQFRLDYLDAEYMMQCCATVALDYDQALKQWQEDPKAVEQIINVAPGVKCPEEQHYTYTDTDVTLGVERFLMGEALFNPALVQATVEQWSAASESSATSPTTTSAAVPVSLSTPTLAMDIAKAYKECSEEHRDTIFSNIVVVGGSTKLPGFQERLKKELKLALPEHIKPKVYYDSEPVATNYKGACFFSRSPLFENERITKNEYEECGAEAIVARLSHL